MKRTFLAKLRTNGIYYIIGALLLLPVVPLYQLLILVPEGYSDALAAASNGHFGPYLIWIQGHIGQFIGSRLLLIIAFALVFSLPFTLFRIIIAQEVLGYEEDEEEEADEEEETEEDSHEELGRDDEDEAKDAFAEAWRGKSFAVIAAWAGLFGIILYVLGTLAGTIQFVISAASYTPQTTVPNSVITLSSIFAILTNTAGGGLLALACLFFGAIIASRGRRLWPGIWVVFGYMALALAALFSGSAVAVSNTPTGGQAGLTTSAILGFALWVLWFGIMLVRLKPE
jgi:hypothetical protein